MFGTQNVTLLHTRDRGVADSEQFVAPLLKATGVFLTPGNAGRIASSYLDTRTQKELESLLARGGVIMGSSAGAIIQGSYIVRGVPGKPVLMARDHERGFGWLPRVAIDPHLTQAKREDELVQVVDAHPDLLGIGLDEGVALVVRDHIAEIIGEGMVAIYDNEQHGNRWYYTLRSGDRFDLARRQKIDK
jgi:cyanophycinase